MSPVRGPQAVPMAPLWLLAQLACSASAEPTSLWSCPAMTARTFQFLLAQSSDIWYGGLKDHPHPPSGKFMCKHSCLESKKELILMELPAKVKRCGFQFNFLINLLLEQVISLWVSVLPSVKWGLYQP